MSRSATKQDLASKVADRLKIRTDEAQKVVDAVFDSAKSIITKRQDLTIRGFGRFKVKTVVGKSACNMQTGEAFIMADYVTVKLVPYGDLKRL